MPPTAAWRLIDIAAQHGYSAEPGELIREALTTLCDCLRQAENVVDSVHAEGRTTALGLLELRRGNHLAALEALATLPEPDGPLSAWTAARHFVRCMAHAALGNDDAATAALSALRETTRPHPRQSAATCCAKRSRRSRRSVDDAARR